MKLTPRQRNAVSAMKMAQTRTKRELKSKEQVKTIVTYPKGLYKKTLEKNLDKAMEEVGLPNRNSKTSSTPKAKKKTAAKKPVAKKAAAKKPVAPKMATKSKDGMSAVSKKKTTAKKKTTSPRKRKTGFVASIKKIFS